MRSSLRADLMKLLSNILFAVLMSSAALLAQEGTWTASFSGGFSSPRLSAVNETLDKTIRDWNTLELIPVKSIGHFSDAPSFGIRGSYRYDRDMSVSISASYSKQKLDVSYYDSAVFLDLSRSVQTTDVMAGLSYFLPPLVFDMEVSIFVDVGLMFARADAVSYNTREEKIGGMTETVVHYDSEAIYTKTKLIAVAGLEWTWNAFGPFLVRAEGTYRFANVGKMDGDIKRLQGTIQEQTLTNFDFSGLSAKLGIGISF